MTLVMQDDLKDATFAEVPKRRRLNPLGLIRKPQPCACLSPIVKRLGESLEEFELRTQCGECERKARKRRPEQIDQFARCACGGSCAGGCVHGGGR